MIKQLIYYLFGIIMKIGPVFHEGLKGWGCCDKKVIDFDDFMKM